MRKTAFRHIANALQMAIWSLTQERVQRLLKQIGDKEVEVDTLIKLSPKDLWTKDLDDFLAEWQFQLDDEAKRNKKLASQGRRASAKLRIAGKGGAGKKRRTDDSDAFSDSDFAAKKAKKVVANRVQPKPSTLMSYLAKATAPAKAASKPLNSIEQKPVSKPPAQDMAMAIDGASDSVEAAMEDDIVPVASKKAKSAASKPATTKAKKPMKASSSTDTKDDDYDEDDVFAAVAKDTTKPSATSTVPARQARNARTKPTKYALSDDSSESDGEDLLGDVSTMVKGIGSSSGDAAPARPLFSASSRPSSSHGLAKAVARRSNVNPIDLSADDDETDYAKLIPRDSPVRLAARSARTIPAADDDDDDDDDDIAFGIVDHTIKIPSKAVAPTLKPSAKSKSLASKVVPKAEPRKTAAAAAVKSTAPKKLPLSPAAKAYAAKQEKAKAAARKKVVQSDSEEELDGGVKALAQELLDDDDDEDDIAAAPATKSAARPSRRAVASKAKYVIDDEDSESEESEPSYDDDDDSE